MVIMIEDFVKVVWMVIDFGFDGVEINGGNGNCMFFDLVLLMDYC